MRRSKQKHEAARVPQRTYAPDNSRLPNKTPLLGLGCSSFSTFFSAEGEESLTVDTMSRDHAAVHGWIETIRHAVLARGIYLLDTAPWYGHGISEVTVGYALDTLLDDADFNEEKGCSTGDIVLPKPRQRKRTGSLHRSELIVNTKVGRYDADPLHQFDFTYETTIKSVHRSLERMNCGYIDVIQLHDPEFSPSISILKDETIPALLECQKKGWARAIGLTGYPLQVQHQILIECQGLAGHGALVFDQSLVYCHNNLHDMSLHCDACFPSNNEEDGKMISYAQFCKHECVHLMAAAPLSMGLLTASGPPSWHPASGGLKEACATAARMAEGVNISTLAILYSLSQPEVGCTLLGMKNVNEVDAAADLAIRFCDVNFDDFGESNSDNQQLSQSNNSAILDQVLTGKENETLTGLLDKDGPFATVLLNGEYRWDGKAEARKFWTLVGVLSKDDNYE